MAGELPGHRFRLAAVSFLNTVPLLEGLDRLDPSAGWPEVRIERAVPSELLAILQAGRADAALLPVIDLQRSAEPLAVIPTGCIASEGETLTVRVFSRTEPTRVGRLLADTDSHTSVALAQVLWAEAFGQALQVEPFRASGSAGADSAEAVLLIGDKVVTDPPAGFAHQVDLGQLWRDRTGLPFVFAVWACRADSDPDAMRTLGLLLAQARQDGAAQPAKLAQRHARQHGWPIELARRYFTRHISYAFTDRHRQGMERFFELAGRHGLIETPRAIPYVEVA